MTLSPTNPGYLAQYALTKKLTGRVDQLLRWTNILLPVFAILLFQLLTILGLIVRTFLVTDYSFRFKSLCNYSHIIPVMVVYRKGQNRGI